MCVSARQKLQDSVKQGFKKKKKKKKEEKKKSKCFSWLIFGASLRRQEVVLDQEQGGLEWAMAIHGYQYVSIHNCIYTYTQETLCISQAT